MMKVTVSEPQSDLDGYFVYVPRVIIDVISGMITLLSERRIYASDEDYERGYNLTALVKGCMLSCPAERLIRTNEALYRLTDRYVNGTVYSITSIEPLVIEPPIPDVPFSAYELPGSLAQLDLANLTLQEIRDALQTDDADPETIAALLQTIAGLLV